MSGAIFLQAQYLQFVLDYTPLAAGLALVPAAAGMLWGTGAGTHLSSHLGARRTVAFGIFLAAAGLAVQATFTTGGSYLPTGIGLLLFGLGAGMAMPAATDSIMSSLPPSSAGVGSAMNDTVREVGGALGVAIVGSVAAASYTSAVSDELTRFADLPEPVRVALSDNVGAALGMTQALGSRAGEIVGVARDAFVTSMRGALWVAAAAAFAGVVVALVSMPKSMPAHSAASPADGEADAPPVTGAAPSSPSSDRDAGELLEA